jgi:hypothetical protein
VSQILILPTTMFQIHNGTHNKVTIASGRCRFNFIYILTNSAYIHVFFFEKDYQFTFGLSFYLSFRICFRDISLNWIKISISAMKSFSRTSQNFLAREYKLVHISCRSSLSFVMVDLVLIELCPLMLCDV